MESHLASDRKRKFESTRIQGLLYAVCMLSIRNKIAEEIELRLPEAGPAVR